MTFFHRQTMLKPLSSWIVSNRIPLIFGVVLLLHAATLGLSDDEAYYWVLAQSPALGYAYHPPTVAWVISAFQVGLGWLVGHSSGLVRLPAVVCTFLTLQVALGWVRKTSENGSDYSSLILLSFAGYFFLAWMMVPDIPLFFGWTLLFVTTWDLCFESARGRSYVLLFLSTVLVILSKFSGVLAAASAVGCLLMWSSGTRRRWGLAAIGVGVAVAAIPILIWNAGHEWASLLYQLRDRHGGDVSWVRFGRFWVAELLLAGPVLVFLGAGGLTKSLLSADLATKRVSRFIFLWAFPAAVVFCIQPLFSDFKLHWAFIVWWPLALFLAQSSFSRGKWIKGQIGYGLGMGLLFLVSCHLPVGGWVIQRFSSSVDPRLDVTNDFYGWPGLKSFVETLPGDSGRLPVVGSRYQTASQAAFSLGQGHDVTLLPRGLKERDEWPDLAITEGIGPGWPRLKSSVLFVADNRYQSGPEFQASTCAKMGRVEQKRFGQVAKWIDVWRCDPT